MVAWTKLFLLLLLCAISANVCVQAAKSKTEKKLPVVEEDEYGFSHEETSLEHDENEILHEESIEEEESEAKIIVCHKKGTSRCQCLKDKPPRIDCQRGKLSFPQGEDVEDYLLETANLKNDMEGFSPKYVYLNGNKIRRIHGDELLPGMETYVEGIDFGMNDIRDIHEHAFSKFLLLRKLRLNHNWIGNITKEKDGWIDAQLGKSLQILNLAYNGIKAVRDGVFDELHTLDRLILDGNPLVLNDTSFGANGLTNLTTLSMDNCNITTLSKNVFKNLPKLSFLSLINNPLVSIPRAIISINSLHTLDLSETWFSKFEGSPLKGLTSVSRLFMKNMGNLTEFGDCAFCGMTNLSTIDLSDSPKLSVIDANAFGYKANSDGKNVKMIEFQVENCNLKTLSKELLTWGLQKKIMLAGNPWDCGDDLDWLIYHQELETLAGADHATCATPDKYKGVTLQKMIKDAHAPSGISGFIKTVFYVGVSVGFVGIALVGFLHLNNKYNGISNLFSRTHRSTGGGFSNLNAEVGMEEERVFDEDDNEFEPRPAAV